MTIASAFAELARGLATAVLPPACAACGRRGLEPFCALCTDALDPARPFAVEGAAAAAAVWSYGGPAKLAVQRLKYDGRPELGAILGSALRETLATIGPADVAVPVPLSRRRLAERGYNQARELARGLDLPVHARALIRSRDAREQVGLDKNARLRNLAGTFHPGPEAVRGARVVLIDDVVTTGATASTATRALLAAGATRVLVLALAHTA